MPTYSWYEIGDVPADPGVYAWYYRPEITVHDLDRVTVTVEELKASAGIDAAKQAIRAFLDESVFRYFREQPFSVRLQGPLKPSYEGLVEHARLPPPTLLARSTSACRSGSRRASDGTRRLSKSTASFRMQEALWKNGSITALLGR